MDSVLYYSRKTLEYESDNQFLTRFTYLNLLNEIGEKDSVNAYLATIENYIPAETPLPNLYNYYFSLAMLARGSDLPDQVIHFANKITDGETNIWVLSKYILLAGAYSVKGDKITAMKAFKAALEKGYDNFARIQNNKYLNSIRDEPEFQALMKKYFPNDYK